MGKIHSLYRPGFSIKRRKRTRHLRLCEDVHPRMLDDPPHPAYNSTASRQCVIGDISGEFRQETDMAFRSSRRDFLKVAGGGLVAGSAVSLTQSLAAEWDKEPQNPIPRWRGFNLLSFFQAFSRGRRSNGMIKEQDLEWIRDWGFDFIRLPMDYWLWIDTDWRKTRELKPDDTFKIDKNFLEKVDRAVELCQKYDLHVNINFHRAPGYCINNPDREPFVLWKSKKAQDAFAHHWDVFAQRYKDVPASDLSFNLVNEAPRAREGYMTAEQYCRIMTRAVKKIREHSPDRPIIVDGLSVGNKPVEGMIGTGVAQSVHGYHPGLISHYRASWVDRNSSFPKPTWPLKNKSGKVICSRETLKDHYAPWGKLVRQGVGVHCGECGCYNKTPYNVFIQWFTAVMDILKTHDIGWAMWNFRGSFGVLDSGRDDIEYEDWHGHKLDRRLLEVLRSH